MYDEKIAELSKVKNKRIAKIKALELAVELGKVRNFSVRKIINIAKKFEEYLLSD